MSEILRYRMFDNDVACLLGERRQTAREGGGLGANGTDSQMEMTAAQRVRAGARAATRMAILEAGLTEMVERGGLETPSIDAICTRAGFTRGAFYVYFSDREQFLTELLEWVLTDIVHALFAGAGEGATDAPEVIRRFASSFTTGRWPDIQDKVRAGYLGVLRAIRPGGSVRASHAALMTDLIDRLQVAVSSGQERGDLRGDLDARDSAIIVVLMGVGAVLWDDIGIEMNVTEVAETMVAMLRTRSAR